MTPFLLGDVNFQRTRNKQTAKRKYLWDLLIQQEFSLRRRMLSLV